MSRFNPSNTAQLLDFKRQMPYGEFLIPSNWGVSLPFKLRRDIDNVMRHTADFSQFTTGGQEYFVDTVSGLDTNDGLTIGTAFKSLGKAIKTSLDSASIGLFKIRIKGFVEDGDGMLGCTGSRWSVPANKQISITSLNDGEKAYICTGGKKTRYVGQWTTNSGVSYLNVTNKEFTTVYDTSKVDSYGIHPPLNRVNTLADCQATKNSFYAVPVAKGGGLWVNYNPTNFFNAATAKTDTTINASGAEASDTTYHAVAGDFMNVSPNTTYTITRAAGGAPNIAWYDASNVFISRTTPPGGFVTGSPWQVTSPANAAKARLISYANNFPDWSSTVMFVLGTVVPSSFVPYESLNIDNIWPVSGQVLTPTNYQYGSNLAFSIAPYGKVYFQDLIFVSGDTSNMDYTALGSSPGCVTCYGVTEKNEVWVKNCYFIGGARGGLDANGYWTKITDTVGGLLTRNTSAFVFNCIAAYNGTDAFSYLGDPNIPKFIAFEYQNVAYKTLGGTTANCSTAHNYMRVIRVGCIYSDSSGGTVVDANGCYTLCIDCHVKNASVGYNPSNVMSCYATYLDQVYADAWGRRGKMILINCTADGSGYSGLDVKGVVDTYLFNYGSNLRVTADIPAKSYVFS